MRTYAMHSGPCTAYKHTHTQNWLSEMCLFIIQDKEPHIKSFAVHFYALHPTHIYTLYACSTWWHTAAYLSDFRNTLPNDFRQQEKKKQKICNEESEQKGEAYNRCLPLKIRIQSVFYFVCPIESEQRIFDVIHSY